MSFFANLTHMVLIFLYSYSGWGGVPGGDGIRGEQGSDLGPAEAAAAGYGPVEGGAAHLHPGAALLPGQAVRLLLPR